MSDTVLIQIKKGIISATKIKNMSTFFGLMICLSNIQKEIQYLEQPRCVQDICSIIKKELNRIG